MKKNKGFTLMELIIVIAIIAVLMLILVPTMGGFVGQAKTEANRANAKAVYTAIVAQNTAAKAGLKDSDGNDYTSITADNDGDACNKANLISPDFYDVDSFGTATCTIEADNSGDLYVDYEDATYPEQ